MRIAPYEPWHLLQIEVQPEQRNDQTLRKADSAQSLGEAGPVFTLLDGDIPLAIAGVANCEPGRGLAWAVLAPSVDGYALALHRGVTRFLAMQTYRRLEAVVDCEHTTAIRWIERLGFEREGRMRKYAPTGRDCYLYSRI